MMHVARRLLCCLLVLGATISVRAEEKPVTAFPITLVDAAEDDAEMASKNPVDRVQLNLWKDVAELRASFEELEKKQARLSDEFSAIHLAVEKVERLLPELEAAAANVAATPQVDDALQRIVEQLDDRLGELERINVSAAQRIKTLEADLSQEMRQREQGDRELATAAEEASMETQVQQVSTEVEMAVEELAEERIAEEAIAEEKDAMSQRAAEQQVSVLEQRFDARVFDVPDEEEAVVPTPAGPEPAMSVRSSKADELVARGNQHLSAGRIEEAEVVFKQALRTDPRNDTARLSLASCYYTRGEYDFAEAHIKELLTQNPDNAQALGLQGILLWRREQLFQATRSLKRAIKLDDSDPQLHNYMGIVLYAKGQLPEALDELRRAVELDPNHAEARFNLAVLLAAGDDAEMIAESKQHYETALRLGNQRDEQLERLLYP